MPRSALVRCMDPPLALHSPVALLISSARHSSARGPAGHRVVVAAIGGEHVVVRAERRARPHGDRLVTGGEVGRALDQAGQEEVVGGLLRAPDDHHLLVQLEQLARLVAAGVSHQRAGPPLALPRC